MIYINELVNIIANLFNNEIDKNYLYSLLSNFKDIVIMKDNIKNVGSYTIDGTIYISKTYAHRIDYLIHELFHVILHGKLEYGLEEAICEYVSTLYRINYNEEETYSYYAQVNILEQINYLYINKHSKSIIIDLLHSLDNYKDILKRIYASNEEVDILLSSLNTLTDYDYHMTWNKLSLEEENIIYKEHDKVFEDITNMNKKYSKEDSKVFKKYF